MFFEAAPTIDEAEMIAVLGAILKHGTFEASDVDPLAAFENSDRADSDARYFARRSIEWLSKQSEMSNRESTNARA